MSNKFSRAVFELAEFIASMHPMQMKPDLWIGTNYILCANEVVRVLRALPAVLQLAPPDGLSTAFATTAGTIQGAVIADESCRARPSANRNRLVVTPAGDVYTVEVGPIATAAKVALEIHDPQSGQCPACGASCRSTWHIDGEARVWPAMPTALAIIVTIYTGTLRQFLTREAVEEIEIAIERAERSEPPKVDPRTLPN